MAKDENTVNHDSVHGVLRYVFIRREEKGQAVASVAFEKEFLSVDKTKGTYLISISDYQIFIRKHIQLPIKTGLA